MAPPALSARIVDITTLATDAIVNAANEALAPGGALVIADLVRGRDAQRPLVPRGRSRRVGLRFRNDARRSCPKVDPP